MTAANRRIKFYAEVYDGQLLPDLLPIIPPNAKLTDKTKLTKSSLGKIPGYCVDADENIWCGFKSWSQNCTDSDDVLIWSSQQNKTGSGVGLQAKNHPAVDIDVDDEFLVNEIERIVESELGASAVRVRDGDGVFRKLIIFKLKEGAEPFKKRRVVFNDGSGMVEFLCNGQQYVIEGEHPSGDNYSNNLGDVELVEVDETDIDKLIEVLKTHFGTEEQKATRASVGRKAGSVYAEVGSRSSRTMVHTIEHWDEGSGRWDALRDYAHGLIKDRGDKFTIVDVESVMYRVPESKRDDDWDYYFSEIPRICNYTPAEDEVKQPVQFSDEFLFKSDPIPDDILPKSLLDAAKEIGDWTGVGKEPAVLSGIGAVSALLSKNVNIHVINDDLVVHSTIAQLIGSSTGGRKTTIYEKMNEPFFTYSKLIDKEWESHSAERKVTHKALTDLLKKANKKLVGTVNDADKTAKEIMSESSEAIEIQRQLDAIQEIKPTLFVGDITESKLIRKIWENGNTLAVFSDDARNFIKNLLGRNRNDGDTDEGIYIAGITNSDYPYNRVGQGGQTIDIMLYRISLNMLLFVQIDGVIKILESDMYRVSGLAARLPIYVHPIDGVSMLRNTSRRSINKEKMKPYYDALKSLCKKLDEPLDIKLSAEAGEAWVGFANQMADMIDKGGEWEGEYDVVNKITTTACIYATIFMAIESKEFLTLGCREISKEYFWKGANYAKFIAGQSIKAQKHLEYHFSLRGVPVVLNHILKEIKNNSALGWGDGFKNDANFRRRHSATHRKNMDVILNCLVEMNWLIKKGELYHLNTKGIEKGVIDYGK